VCVSKIGGLGKMEIIEVKISDLSRDPANARKHDERNLAATIASFRRFGQQHPIVIDRNNVVRAGSCRLDAAEALGWDTIKAVRSDLSGSDAIAYAIAGNRTSELAEWDEDILAAQLQGLLTDDEALLEAAGFDEDELAELLGDLDDDEPGEITEDEVPEPPVDPITKPGDLWVLGRHRVLCGDSTKADDVARLMGGAKADLLLADPPYGIGIASNPVRQKHAKQKWDERPAEAVDLLPMVAMANVAILWGGNYYDLPPQQCFLVWDKKQPEDFSVGMCEMAWTNLPGPAKLYRQSVTSYEKEHCTQKPVELMAWCIGRSNTDGIILDTYLGSGTTLIAAEQLNRTCYGMEISPQYCDVIVKRWENLTGEKATLQGASNAKR
jgi:DNA modification methylase